MTLTGGGSGAFNQNYTYDTSVKWVGETTPHYDLHLEDPTLWIAKDQLLTEIYDLDMDAGAVFPYGPWGILGGVSPAPFGSVPVALTQSVALTFYTSVAGQYDYMWQNDAALATASTIVTNLSVALNNNDAFTLPMEWPADSVPEINT